MFNDRKAARFNTRKYRKNIITEALYKKWKEEYKFDISFSQFKKYWKLIAKEYTESCVNEMDGIKFGASMGDLYIGYVPSKNKPVDHITSQKLGKTIYFENWNTNGKLGKIIYGVRGRKYIYRGHRFWSFTATRSFKNIVKSALRNFPERFKNSIEKRSL